MSANKEPLTPSDQKLATRSGLFLRLSSGTLWILGEPVMFFDLGSALFHGWRILFAPGSVVPGNRLESIVARLKSHGRFGGLTLGGVEGNHDLITRIDPMPKERSRAISCVFRDCS